MTLYIIDPIECLSMTAGTWHIYSLRHWRDIIRADNLYDAAKLALQTGDFACLAVRQGKPGHGSVCVTCWRVGNMPFPGATELAPQLWVRQSNPTVARDLIMHITS